MILTLSLGVMLPNASAFAIMTMHNQVTDTEKVLFSVSPSILVIPNNCRAAGGGEAGGTCTIPTNDLEWYTVQATGYDINACPRFYDDSNGEWSVSTGEGVLGNSDVYLKYDGAGGPCVLEVHQKQ
jgi:hypothetical protein